jgi:hypothetical protein
MPNRTSSDGPGGPQPGTRYYFSFTAELDPLSIDPITVPGGTRVHVNYSNSVVNTDASLYQTAWGIPPDPSRGDVDDELKEQIQEQLQKKPDDRPRIADLLRLAREQGVGALETAAQESSQKNVPPFWTGISGTILSGRDAVLVRQDGVAVYDSRFAISANGFVIDVRAAATIDLMRALGVNSGAAAYEHFRRGDRAPRNGSLRMKMWFRFEPSSGAGDAARYAAPRYVLQSLSSWKYEPLARGQFIGNGKLQVRQEPHWPATRIAMDVFEVLP